MNHITSSINAHIQTIQNIDIKTIEAIGQGIIQTLKSDKKIILFGNGGSASDAQHIAAEFVGRFVTERKALPAISLAENTSNLTAIGNDYGYENVFSRQMEALAQTGDFAIGISTSGNSPNVVNALKIAKAKGLTTCGLMGKDGGEMKDLVDLNCIVPSQSTARIQEAHILIGHILCQMVDDAF